MKWYLSHRRHGNKPWAVQAEAMRRADGASKFGQFLEQGLGKTALSLNEFMTSVHAGRTDLNIVCVPNSFKADWPLAVHEWGLDMPIGMWPHDPLPTDWEWGLYAINYEAARQGAKDGLLRLLDQRQCFLTIDESGVLKNPQSDTTRAVIEMAKRATMVRALNGTPMTHTVMDYWGQLRSLGELNGINPYAFRNRYAVLGGYMGKQVKGMKNEEELGRILDRCSFRALKSEWRKDLPPQIETPVHLEMSDKQRKHYQTMMEEFFAEVEDGEVTADLVLTQMGKLRQISSGLLLQEGKAHWIEEPAKNPKLRACLDLMADGAKTIVSHVYTDSGHMLLDAFQKAKLHPAYLRGNMNPQEVLRQKERFNHDPECRVLVGQQSATHRGHTLIGKDGDRCARMIFFENDFSYYQRAQMKDRNHRGDQDETCTIFDLITSPMDQIVVDTLVGRRNTADAMDALVAEVRRQRRR